MREHILAADFGLQMAVSGGTPGGGDRRALEGAWTGRLQSAVMPASLTTFAHSATSALMTSANWESGAVFGSQPAKSSFSRTSATAKAASSDLLMRSTIGRGVAGGHHYAKPGRHLRLGIPLFGQGRHVREIFGAAIIDRADDPDGTGLRLRQRLIGRQEGRHNQPACDIRHHGN
jgi:hypothetical protein